VPTTTIYERRPPNDTLIPDRFGEVRVTYRNLRVGFGYGLCWLED
jgi:hypothetical protein